MDFAQGVQRKGVLIMAKVWNKMTGDENQKKNDSWKFENVGDEVTGRYIDRRDNVKVGENSKTIYTLKKDDGVEVAVWGNTIINKAMANVTIGNEVRIVFLGKEPTKTPGQKYNNFDVFSREVEEGSDKNTDVNPDDIPF